MKNKIIILGLLVLLYSCDSKPIIQPIPIITNQNLDHADNTLTKTKNIELGKFYSIYDFFTDLDVSIETKEKDITVGLDEKYPLNYYIRYSDKKEDISYNDKSVTISSMDENILKVDKYDNLTGINEGATSIILTSKYNPLIKQEIKVKVDKTKIFTNKEVRPNKDLVYINIVPRDYGISFGNVIQIGNPDYIISGFDPEISPNKEKIISLGFTDNDPMPVVKPKETFNYYLNDTFTTKSTRLTNSKIPKKYTKESVSWSYDSKYITYLCNLENKESEREQICIVDTDNLKVKRITNENNEISDSIYSPSENKISYLKDIDNEKKLFFINPETLQSLQISHNNVLKYKWSPDGKKIAYISNDKTGINSIYLLDITSMTEEKVNTKLDDIHSVDWFPDNSNLLIRTYKEKKGNSISRFDLNTKKENLIISTNLSISYKVSPDSKYILYVTDLIYISDIYGNIIKKIKLPSASIDWLPDSENFILSTCPDPFNPVIDCIYRAYIFEINNGSITKVSNFNDDSTQEIYVKWLK